MLESWPRRANTDPTYKDEILLCIELAALPGDRQVRQADNIEETKSVGLEWERIVDKKLARQWPATRQLAF
jgi:hypothetical protein